MDSSDVGFFRDSGIADDGDGGKDADDDDDDEEFDDGEGGGSETLPLIYIFANHAKIISKLLVYLY